MPALARHESQRHCGFERFLARRSTTNEALNISGFAAERNLPFSVLTQKLTPKQRLVRGRSFRW